MNERLLREWIRQSLLLEAGVEHQEYALVDLINNVVAQNDSTPITISAGGLEISNVTGAAKVTGNAAYGGEPYTDVIFWQGSDTPTTPSAGSMNISCKIEGGAPSVINLSKGGLKQCYPGWYEAINQVALEKYASLGVPVGHWSVAGNAISKGSKKASNLYNVLMRINPEAAGKVSIHTLDGKEYKLDAGQNPPIAGGFGPSPTTADPDGRVHYHNQNEAVVPDLFGIVPAETIRAMFVGNEAMGGPVTYIYEGPADPAAGHTFENGKLAISGRFKVPEDLIQTQSDDATVTGAKEVVLRIRKRRFDAAVGKSGDALTKGPITGDSRSGVKGGGIRFVSTMKASGSSGVHITIPDYMTDVGPPSGWNPSAPCSYTPPPADEALIRDWVRKSLLTEELTKADKKEVDKLVKKGIERDRVEQKRIIRKEIEAELKTSLGKSFFGNPGKVRKAIEEIARAELSKEMKRGSDLENSVVEITKKVLGAWHEMLYKQQNIINRIKIK